MLPTFQPWRLLDIALAFFASARNSGAAYRAAVPTLSIKRLAKKTAEKIFFMSQSRQGIELIFNKNGSK
jgi:hypothetical protein